MVKKKIFNTRHIKVEIRPPDERKDLDMNDSYDLEQAKIAIFREWRMIEDDVKKFFNIVVIDGKPYIYQEKQLESQN